LPAIIKSLAQQVANRDAWLKNAQARFDEELASVRHQAEEMRLERDQALRSVDELDLQRNQLKDQLEAIRVEWSIDVERTRMQDERELAKEKALRVTDRAELELERVESKTKVRVAMVFFVLEDLIPLGALSD